MRTDRHREITIGRGPRQPKSLRVYVPGGYVEITTGMLNGEGQNLVAVDVTADQFPGEPQYGLQANGRDFDTRLVQRSDRKGVSLRIVEEEPVQ